MILVCSVLSSCGQVLICQSLGAVAVIVGNVPAPDGTSSGHYGEDLLIMKRDSGTPASASDINITAAFVADSTYQTLIDAYHNNDGQLEVTIGDEFGQPHNA